MLSLWKRWKRVILEIIDGLGDYRLRIQSFILEFLFEMLITCHEMDRSLLYPLFLLLLWLTQRPNMIQRYIQYSTEKQVNFFTV